MRMGVVMVLATLAIPPLYQGLAQSCCGTVSA
jgi:hypothetical protein